MFDIKGCSISSLEVRPHRAGKNFTVEIVGVLKNPEGGCVARKREEGRRGKRIARQTRARSLTHQSFRLFALSRAISPRDLSIPPTCLAPFFLPFDTCTLHCRLLHIAISVRYPFPEYLAPSRPAQPRAASRGALYGVSFPADVFGMYRSA